MYDRAVAVHEPLTRELVRLLVAGAVIRWHSDQLRVFSFRPPSDRGRRPLMYLVSITVESEFVDFEQLSAFLDRWAAEEGVEVGYTNWDVTEEHRREYEAALRREAVADATAKGTAEAFLVLLILGILQFLSLFSSFRKEKRVERRETIEGRR